LGIERNFSSLCEERLLDGNLAIAMLSICYLGQ